jgi:hypothetical protein
MVQAKFQGFLSEVGFGDDCQFRENGHVFRLNLSLGLMVLKDVDNFNEKPGRASVH